MVDVGAKPETQREAIELARLEVARLLAAQPEEIVFTASGSEANNLALRGVLDLADALDEARLHRQLGSRQKKRLTRELDIDTADFEHDLARTNAAHPVFRRTLAGAHADFGRLLRHRDVGEHADPHTAGTLHMTRDGTAGRLDLARG